MIKSQQENINSGEIGGLPKTHINDNKVAPQGDAKKESVEPRQTVSKASAIILVLAIGAHAFFEGIAFGLQTTVESAF